MRFLTFRREGGATMGAAIGDNVLDLPRAAAAMDISGWPPDLDLRAFLGMGESALDKARRTIAAVEEELRRGDGGRLASRSLLFPRDAVKLMAPVPDPSKVIAIGLNYRDHAREQGAPIPEKPDHLRQVPDVRHRPRRRDHLGSGADAAGRLRGGAGGHHRQDSAESERGRCTLLRRRLHLRQRRQRPRPPVRRPAVGAREESRHLLSAGPVAGHAGRDS